MILTLDSPLSKRLLKIIFGIYFFIAFVATTIQLISEYLHEENSVKTEIEELVNVFLPTIADSLWNFNTENARYAVNGIHSTKSVIGVDLKSDEMNFSFGVDDTSNNGDDGGLSEPIKVYEYVFPIVYPQDSEDGVEIGRLTVHSGSNVVFERSKHAFYSTIINAIIKTLCLWVIFYITIKLVVAKPLNILTDSINRIAKDGVSLQSQGSLPKILTKQRDELGVVMDAFAKMSISLYNQQQELLDHQKNLEDIVDDRTKKLKHQANHDPLTGLPNRRNLEDKLNNIVRVGGVCGHDVESTLCFLDLDRFKPINDTYGHYAGDFVLTEIAKLVKNFIRDSDVISRFGGDEFCILLQCCPLSEGEKIANKILNQINQSVFKWEGVSLTVGASIGLTSICRKTNNINDVIRQADSACYVAKAEGRNQIYTFNEQHQSIKRKYESHWVDILNAAMNNGQLVLFFQKIEAIGSNYSLPAIEILIRLIDDDDQIIPAASFMPSLEYFGMSEEVDIWVVEKTFEFFDKSPDIFSQFEFVSINLSALSLCNKELDESIRKLLEKYSAIKPDKICFEITESAKITDLEEAFNTIIGIKELGFKIALDDFGSGFSSFSYLRHFPVDILKIDGSLVKDVTEKPCRVMLEAITMMSTAMNKCTVAEFVENQEICQVLMDIGIDYAQGYHFSKPVNISTLLPDV